MMKRYEGRAETYHVVGSVDRLPVLVADLDDVDEVRGGRDGEREKSCNWEQLHVEREDVGDVL